MTMSSLFSGSFQAALTGSFLSAAAFLPVGVDIQTSLTLHRLVLTDNIARVAPLPDNVSLSPQVRDNVRLAPIVADNIANTLLSADNIGQAPPVMDNLAELRPLQDFIASEVSDIKNF